MSDRTTPNVERYLLLRNKEIELRHRVIVTENPTLEEARIKIALEREELLFKLTMEELDILMDRR